MASEMAPFLCDAGSYVARRARAGNLLWVSIIGVVAAAIGGELSLGQPGPALAVAADTAGAAAGCLLARTAVTRAQRHHA